MNEELKKIFLRSDGKLVAQRINEHYIKNHGLYDVISNSFDDSYSLEEKIYCLTHDVINRPHCKTCDKELNFYHGYGRFCSITCRCNDEEILNKNRAGVSKALKKAYEERGDEIKQKRADTLFKTYGEIGNSPFSMSSIQAKARESVFNIYGVENVFSLEQFRYGKKSLQDKSVKTHKINGYDVEYIDINKLIVKNLCQIHPNIEIDCITFYNRTYRNRTGVKCPICNPIHSFSSLESEFKKILKNLNIENYLCNKRSVIPPQEIDFYFPEQKLAIELNGVYWHSEIHRPENYHVLKSDLCEEKNIQLIHIWEDDFYNNRDLVISMLKNKFNLIENKIYARNCIIKNINSKTYRLFLDENHLQRKINSSIRYGLYHNNILIAVMGFGKLRKCMGTKHDNNTFELQRFCTLKDTNIVGGASKLLSNFKKNIQFDKIISYAKRDYSVGNLYLNLGFKLEKKCGPGYYWLVNGKRMHRFNFRKNRISTEENKHMTEVEIMKNNGFIRCFDSGNLKFVLSNPI